MRKSSTMPRKHILLSTLLTAGLFQSTYAMQINPDAYTIDIAKITFFITQEEKKAFAIKHNEARKTLILDTMHSLHQIMDIEETRQERQKNGFNESYPTNEQKALLKKIFASPKAAQSRIQEKATAQTSSSAFEAAFKKNLSKKK